MPISLSAKKSLRKSIKNRKANVFFKTQLKAVLKKFLGKPTEENYKEAQSMLDKARKNGIVHKNKASRVKSQLSKKLSGTAPIAAKAAKNTAKKVVKKTTKRTAKEKMSK